MKRCFVIIIFLVVHILTSCNMKEINKEENVYNPYDTNEFLDTFSFSADTIYTMDSVAKSFRLQGNGK